MKTDCCFNSYYNLIRQIDSEANRDFLRTRKTGMNPDLMQQEWRLKVLVLRGWAAIIQPQSSASSLALSVNVGHGPLHRPTSFHPEVSRERGQPRAHFRQSKHIPKPSQSHSRRSEAYASASRHAYPNLSFYCLYSHTPKKSVWVSAPLGGIYQDEMSPSRFLVFRSFVMDASAECSRGLTMRKESRSLL